MSKGRHEDWNDIVDIEFDEVVKDSGKAILFKIEDAEVWVGYGAIENLDEVQEKLKDPDLELKEVQVPKWLAVENGWAEWDDD